MRFPLPIRAYMGSRRAKLRKPRQSRFLNRSNRIKRLIRVKIYQQNEWLRSEIFHGAHDGLEREFKSFNWLEGVVCTACAPRDQEKSTGSKRGLRSPKNLASNGPKVPRLIKGSPCQHSVVYEEARRMTERPARISSWPSHTCSSTADTRHEKVTCRSGNLRRSFYLIPSMTWLGHA